MYSDKNTVGMKISTAALISHSTISIISTNQTAKIRLAGQSYKFHPKQKKDISSHFE